MTKILVNRNCKQLIFDNYMELLMAFKTTMTEIKLAERTGKPLIDRNTGIEWYVDTLEDE